METRKTANDITGLTDPSASYHAIFSAPGLMAQWLDAAPTLRARLIRATHCLEVARDPRFRFKLESVPAETTEVIESALAGYVEQTAPLCTYLHDMRADGQAWDTTWSLLPDVLCTLGFAYGDSRLLAL